jgi:Protein of unknown function (DUF1524)
VFVAFETMNNRGKPLSHLELLKNRLIYLSTKFSDDESEKNQLRHTINAAWMSIYHYLGKNKDKPLDDDMFLINHFMIYYGSSLIEKRILKENSFRHRYYRDFHEDYLLEEIFTTKNICQSKNSDKKNTSIAIKDVYDYVKSLKDSVEIWFQILNPKDSQFDDQVKAWLEKLNRLGIRPYTPLVMVFFQKTNGNNSLRLKFLKSLEKLVFFIYLIRDRFMYYHVSIHELDFNEICLQLRENTITPENLVKQIEGSFESLQNNNEFMVQAAAEFRKKGFYEWKGIKYLLYEYEISLKESSKTYRDKISWDEYIEDRLDYHTIEHIYPQRPKKQCWTDKYNKYSDRERTALRHSLGNLVPLSQAKNSTFQNKCFCDKKVGEESCVGFIYGSFSENEIAQQNHWTAKEIMMRGLKLLTFMETRWDLDFGGTEEKLKFLHLEFVPQKENIEMKDSIPKNKSKKI